MIFTIDTNSFSRENIPGPGRGGPRAKPPTTIVIHSTNGNQGSSFKAEAAFLRDSKAVSAHYLVGKEGQIVQILPPSIVAWQAGDALSAYVNTRSIGIECHHAEGDTWPVVQRSALTWLVRRLMHEHSILINRIDTHRAVAVPGPNIRKHDPSDWSDDDFYTWRTTLTALGPMVDGPTPALPWRFRVRVPTPVFTDRNPAAPLAGTPGNEVVLAAGSTIEVGDITDNWAWNLSGAGFCPIACLERI